MRILVTTQQWFPDVTGGVGRVAHATAVGLAGRGHKVVVIAPKFDHMPAYSNEGDVEVRRVIRRHWAVPLTATDVLETRRLVRATDECFDLVLGHDPPSVVGAAAALARTPIVYVFHASWVLEERFRRSLGLPLVAKTRSLLVEPILLWLEKAAAAWASQVIVLSRYSQRVLSQTQQSVGRLATVAGGGVDIAEFCPAADRSAVREKLGIAPDVTSLLLSVRRLVRRMGIDVLLRAVSQLREHDGSIKLVVAGEGEMQGALERERDRLKLSPHVAFLGRVPEPDLQCWYQAADLFVLPTVAYEGFGMVTAEALACGTPVVGTRVGATGEILEPLDSDLLAVTPTSDGLVAAIRRTLDRVGPELRGRCRSYAESQLAWESVLARWEAVLRQAAEMGNLGAGQL